MLKELTPTLKPIAPLWARLTIFPSILIFFLGGIVFVFYVIDFSIVIAKLYPLLGYLSLIFVFFGFFMIYLSWSFFPLFKYRQIRACLVNDKLIYVNWPKSNPIEILIEEIAIENNNNFRVYHLVDSAKSQRIFSFSDSYKYSMSIVNTILSIQKASTKAPNNSYFASKQKFIQNYYQYEKASHFFNIILIPFSFAIMVSIAIIVVLFSNFEALYMFLLLIIGFLACIHMMFLFNRGCLTRYRLLCPQCKKSLTKATNEITFTTGNCGKCGESIFKDELPSKSFEVPEKIII